MNKPSMNAIVLSKQSMLKQNFDIREGRDQIILNRDTYFNKLDQQDPDQFESMIAMAPVYVLYPKIVDGFVGTVFAKDPLLKGVEDKSISIVDNVDMLGNNFNKFSEKVVKEVFENGFCATYNDYSGSAERSFVQFVPASKFISFRVSEVEGHPAITQFIYTDDVETDDPDDEFSTLSQTEYTVLDLAENDNGDVRYRIRVLIDEKDGYTEHSSSFPTMDGKQFERIPLQINGVDANNYTIKKSPLQDLSDMNISIMQRVVDQVYMLHWTALPTPWVTGVDDDDAATTIGPSNAWRLSSPESKVGMLEFSGNSARAHQDYIDNLKEIMAATGAQILKKEGVSRETATSVLVRTSAQTSLVATLVGNISLQMERTLKLHLEWANVKPADDFSYRLNEDFLKVDMEPNAQIALVKSWMDGAISHKTLFTKMKEGELIEPNKTFEQEFADIQKNPPPFFSKQADAKIASEAAEVEAANQAKIVKDGLQAKDSSGSNLENGNIANNQATEQA